MERGIAQSVSRFSVVGEIPCEIIVCKWMHYVQDTSFPIHFSLLSPSHAMPCHAMPCNHPISPFSDAAIPMQVCNVLPRLADSSMNTLTHRSLPSPPLRLTSRVDARTRMLFLGASIFALAQDREVGFIVVLLLVSFVLSSPFRFYFNHKCTLCIYQRIWMQR